MEKNGLSIWQIAKGKFDNVKGEFVKEEGSFDEVKKGRSTVEEKTAKQNAQSSKDEAAVIGSKGEIRLKPGVVFKPTQPKPTQPSPVRPQPSPVRPQPTAPAQPGPVSNTTINTQAGTGGISKSKYPDDEREAAIKTLNQMGISVEDVQKELASRHVIDHKVKQEKMTK